jgi:hypothetical protein
MTAAACTTAWKPVAASVVQLRVPEDTPARIDEIRGDATRSAWLLRLIDRELVGQQPAPVTATDSPVILLDGEPCPRHRLLAA